ncbi:DUF58 domain-containing protein [Myxococcota bacterium]|nr:DUF58 domain-containing protein [Myxococcota bacterium]MBU1381270.1 DUF58 domain-containing protein [Myxococcota bacterium]MBU1498275.1 DUF58 domain-containing protein [Myxococcota bacterium]
MTETEIPQGEIAVISVPEDKKEKSKERFYPSSYLMGFGGIACLIIGAISLRVDILLFGIIPFTFLAWVMMSEFRMGRFLKKNPLRGLAYPPSSPPRAGKPINFKVELINTIPVPLGIIKIETRTCAGISTQGSFFVKIGPESRTELNIEIIPLRTGRVFFYGLSIIITSPFGFRPRRYYLILPISLAALPPLADPMLTRKLDRLPVYERFPRPGLDGDLAELREYLPGDPIKALVKNPSLKKQKPVIRLSFPEKKGTWQILLDVTPEMTRGIPGYAPLDHCLTVIPHIIRKLQKQEHEAGIILFRQSVELFMNRIKINKLISVASEFRYRSLELTESIDILNIYNFIKYLSYNFGTILPPPESLNKEAVKIFKENLVFIYRTLTKPKGSQAEPVEPVDSLNTILTKISLLTGYEPPAPNEYRNGIEKAIDQALNFHCQNMIIFSELAPHLNETILIPRLKVASGRGIRVFFLILDSNLESVKPFGKKILEKEAEYRWGSLINKIRSTGASVIYWNPWYPESILSIFR